MTFGVFINVKGSYERLYTKILTPLTLGIAIIVGECVVLLWYPYAPQKYMLFS